MISGGVILLTCTLFLLFGITRPWLLASLAFGVGFGVLGMGILVLAWMTRITPEPCRKALYQYQFWAANVISVLGFGLGLAILRWMDVRSLCVVNLSVIAFAYAILLLCELKGGFVPPTNPSHGIGLVRRGKWWLSLCASTLPSGRFQSKPRAPASACLT
jgi:MFS family permease